jgi:hypothetical protein
VTHDLAGIRSAPLHELEGEWKAGASGQRLYGQIVAEHCLCGGVIRARNTDAAITEAVRIHNASPAHAQWATFAGWRHG